MSFEWVCDSCRSPNKPETTVCAHCGALGEPRRASRGFEPTGQLKYAAAVFLGVEAVVLVLYMGGVDLKLTGINVAFVGLVVALLAAVLTYFWGARRADQ